MKQKAIAPAANLFAFKLLFLGFATVAMLATSLLARAQDTKAYPSMAPLDQYLMEREAEISLARSAAPDSISKDAQTLVLGRHGYEPVGTGKNGFVCMVQRSWAAGLDDPEFWNPKVRAPICLNQPAVRSYLPQIVKKTDWVFAGQSQARMREDIKSALASKELSMPEIGAMCYMMSKRGYLSDSDGHWHPHLMFFLPLTDPTTWGAGLPGSPIFGSEDRPGGLTIFIVPVGRWSDGTVAVAGR
jgi:hypothetical protein